MYSSMYSTGKHNPIGEKLSTEECRDVFEACLEEGHNRTKGGSKEPVIIYGMLELAAIGLMNKESIQTLFHFTRSAGDKDFNNHAAWCIQICADFKDYVRKTKTLEDLDELESETLVKLRERCDDHLKIMKKAIDLEKSIEN